MSKTVLLCLCSVLLLACTNTGIKKSTANNVILGYDGAIRSFDEVAVIIFNTGYRDIVLNGKPISEYRRLSKRGLSLSSRYQLHVIPGIHKFDFHYDWSNQQHRTVSLGRIRHEFTMEKGETVLLSMRSNPENNTGTPIKMDWSRDREIYRNGFELAVQGSQSSS